MAKSKQKNPHAQALGRLGGKAKSARKTQAVRLNGFLGGRPRKDGKPCKRRKPLPLDLAMLQVKVNLLEKLKQVA